MALRFRPRFPIEGVSEEWFRRKNNPKYFTHREQWLQKPALNGDLAATGEATHMIASSDWELSGRGTAVTADVTFNADGGGIEMETQGTQDDQVIIQPHADTGVTNLANMLWKTAKEPYMQINIVTGDALTERFYWMGFGTANGNTKTTIDAIMGAQDDAFWMVYATEQLTSVTNWVTVSSRTSTETETDTGVLVAVSTVYRMELFLDADRVPNYYINGAKVSTGDSVALGAAHTDLIPIFGVHSTDGGEADMVVHDLTISQLYG